VKKINAVIIDDEKGVRELLCLLLEKHCPEVTIVGEASTIEKAYEEICALQPNLLFLDIKMPRGSGFALLQKFEKRDFEVIFTTSYAEYALPAIKANATDYLLKPYDANELKIAVEKAQHKLELINKLKSDEISIQVHINNKVEQINAKDILWLEAQNNYSQITMVDNTRHVVAKVLADVEAILKPLNYFLRIHRSIIVNRNFVKSYSKVPPYYIVLTNDETFEVSRRKKAEIIEALKNK
jgi:two-component system LytT family response regulator